jgi:hypothetical protein
MVERVKRLAGDLPRIVRPCRLAWADHLAEPQRDSLLIDGVELETDESVVGQFESEG